jgi:heterodisulfide reductase subunit C
VVTKKNNDTERIRREILDYIEPKIYNCYQCGKCTSSCPLSDVFEYKANQVIRLVQAGNIDAIINSNSIFLCLSCAICSSRCPQDIHIATIMNFIRNEAWKTNRFKIKSIARFYKTFLRIVGRTGRSFEPGLLISLNFLSGRLFNDMDLALDILKKRKIRLLPEFIKGRKQITKTIKKYM